MDFNEMMKAEAQEVYIPDEYRFDCDGHAVDVCASTYCTNKIERLLFVQHLQAV